MAHPHPVIASIQTRCPSPKQVLELHAPDIAAILSQVNVRDTSVKNKLSYAKAHRISIALSDTEMASLLSDIKASGG